MRALLSPAIIIPYINIFYAYTHTHSSTRVCVHLRMGSWKLIEKLPRRSKLGEPKSQKRNHIFCTLTQFSAPPPSRQDLTPFADFLLFADPFRHTKLIIFDATHNNNGNPGRHPHLCVCVWVFVFNMYRCLWQLHVLWRRRTGYKHCSCLPLTYIIFRALVLLPWHRFIAY